MFSAKLAREQSELNRRDCVNKHIEKTLNDIKDIIDIHISKGETYVWIDTTQWVVGLNEAVAKELIKEGYHIVIKTYSCQIGISWTNA